MSIRREIIYSNDKTVFGEIEIIDDGNVKYANLVRFGTTDKSDFDDYNKVKDILKQAYQLITENNCQYIISKVVNAPAGYLLLKYLDKVRVFSDSKELSKTDLESQLEQECSTKKSFLCETEAAKSSTKFTVYYPIIENAPMPFCYMVLSKEVYEGKGKKVIKITDTKPDTDNYIISRSFNVGDEDKFDIYVSDNAIQSTRKRVK